MARRTSTQSAGSGLSASALATIAMLFVIIALIVTSPIALTINGRNIEDIDMLAEVDADSAGAWLLRVATMMILGGSIGAAGLGYAASRSTVSTAPLVMGGYLVFFVTNSVINSMLGTVPSFSRTQVYPLLILAAVYVQRLDHEYMLEVAKCALAAVMVISLPLAVLMPTAMLRSYAPELRLPLVGFRYWGLGNSPNTTGPLALLMILLLIHRPFNSMVLQITTLAAAAITLLLAQSQTAWIASICVLPAYLLYRRYVGDGEPYRDSGGRGWLVVTLGALCGVTAFLAYGPGVDVGNDAFTGRGRIWHLAIKLFQASPLFGYGPTAWETEFRARFDMPFAFTAHSQLFHSLSSAGLVGLIGWLCYLGTLVVAAVRLARPTRGLAPALLVAFPFIRSFSEASFDFKSITADEFVLHLIMFIVLIGSPRDVAPAQRPAIRTDADAHI